MPLSLLLAGALLLAAAPSAPAARFTVSAGVTNRAPLPESRRWNLRLEVDPAIPSLPPVVTDTNRPAAGGPDGGADNAGSVFVTTNVVLFFDNATKTTTNLVQVITNFIPSFKPNSGVNRYTNDRVNLDRNLAPTTQAQGPIEVDSAIRLVLGGRTNLIVTDALGRSTNIQFTGSALTNLAAVPGASETNAVVPPVVTTTREPEGQPALDVLLSAYQVPSLESRFTGWGLLLLATAEHPPLFPGLNQFTTATVLTNLSAPRPAWLTTNAAPASPRPPGS